VARVIWSPEALDDLDETCRSIARDSPARAEAFARRIRTAVEQLATFPRSGRIVPELQIELLRELIVGNYRVIYRYSETEVEIATILHAARPLTDLS
jgi:toxin ParE1/3/4